MNSPIEQFAQRAIGTVESVSPDEIKAVLDIDAPRSTAIIEGMPTPFPSINSYALIPTAGGALVGLITWLGVERSPFPKRSGFKDFGVIDLPYPLRKIALAPLGMLSTDGGAWKLERGVRSFPSVGDTVILPTKEQTTAIVRGRGTDSRVPLGTCPAAYNTILTADPNKLFGRHLAVLGNTGSGKSCTVAGLIRASVQSAEASLVGSVATPNARFIVLDPNGEYSECFSDLGNGCRVFQIPPVETTATPFVLPAWLWNSREWSSIAQAAPRTQRPLLLEALRTLRSGGTIEGSAVTRVAARLRAAILFVRGYAGSGAHDWSEATKCGEYLAGVERDIQEYVADMHQGAERTAVEQYLANLHSFIDGKRKPPNTKGNVYYKDFDDSELRSFTDASTELWAKCGGNQLLTVNEDTPRFFQVADLADLLDVLAEQHGGNTAQYVSTLSMRIRLLLSDARMKGVVEPEKQPALGEWLTGIVGDAGAANGQIAVIDMSLVPFELLHLTIAVAARLVFESLQRYRQETKLNLPTVMVLEEAHTFVVRRQGGTGDEIERPEDMCRHVFERVAREGRKFGLGLVLSSQRPSELSETVLSQCNSFLLHRITNDRDQDLVARLVPDNARGILRELPSLPTRQAVLMGLATEIPVLLDVPELSEKQRPRSDDPKFWEVWTGTEKREIDWDALAHHWAQGCADPDPSDEEGEVAPE
jgi:uncharacterized protein